MADFTPAKFPAVDLTDKGLARFERARRSWAIYTISRDPPDLRSSLDYWWDHCEQVLADWRRLEPAHDDPPA